MITRLRRGDVLFDGKNTYNPKNPFMDSRRKDLFKKVEEDDNYKRMDKCLSGIMLLHAMQYKNAPAHGPASESVLNGLKMILDKKGVSNSVSFLA